MRTRNFAALGRGEQFTKELCRLFIFEVNWNLRFLDCLHLQRLKIHIGQNSLQGLVGCHSRMSGIVQIDNGIRSMSITFAIWMYRLDQSR